MVGGGSRRDEGSLVIKNSNVFAALDTLRKKKKSDKEKKNRGSSKPQAQSKEPEPQVFWAPAPLTVSSWADVDDDDDYYATTAPPQSVWGASEPQQSKENPDNLEDSETEEDILDEGDDDGEEEHEHEHEHESEVPVHHEPEARKPAELNVAPKEAERQLSKKERKKKELAELEALLADFGVTKKESNGQEESSGVPQEKKDAEHDADGEKKESATAESRSAKKKKKKDKAAKEVKESQDQPNNADASNGLDVGAGSEQTDEDSSAVDVKERLKKVASMRKKKSSKEMDAAARAAAQEAAARSARLAAAKKKEKNHYNQQPVR
ncbi:stress response protein NST1-like [Quillaja saponaria]|uniref:Stress response protein NST1-like n=1 Tax=Quillaja saponaria TaxID=32244 RepID=A0AAD7LXF3_QUISA|nr:stress response protein NST1-like [Quillaja saponaria]